MNDRLWFCGHWWQVLERRDYAKATLYELVRYYQANGETGRIWKAQRTSALIER